MMEQDQDTDLYIKYGETGDPKLFRALWDKYKGAVLTTIMRITLLPKEGAEDILQEVFIKVMDERGRFTPKAKFGTWLYRMAVNRSYNAVRDKKEQVEIDDRLPDEKADYALDRLVDKERAIVLKKALGELNERQRAALTLREFQEKSYAEIAEIMEVSLDAVESLLFHARTKLKSILKGRI
ncbi:MAG: sigma-70 family RNA polymerase sigma factor [Fibrobacteres bacterium]|nr:sigma-70 family RNA polymerase sigma factor [Fibrobacterota bacterium]